MFVITLIILAIAAWFLIQYLRKRTQAESVARDSLDHDHTAANQPPAGQQGAIESDVSGAVRAGTTTSDQPHGGAQAQTARSPDKSMASDVAHLSGGERRGNVREMMKILNLRDSDASRLDISKEDFARLWQADASASESLVDDVSARLRSMMH